MKFISCFVRSVVCPLAVATTVRANVWLSSYSFAPNNLPTINSDDGLSYQYKLRAKINPGAYQSANDFNNNGMKLDSVPAPGNYTVDLYWLQYDSTGTTLLTIGPTTTQNLTILQPSNGVLWEGIGLPSAGLPGQTITFSATVYNNGNTLWDSNYYLELKDWNGTHLAYPPLATTSPGGTISPTFTLTLPSTAGTYTYYFTAMQNGVEYFGPTQSATIVVNTNPSTTLSTSSTSINAGQSVTLTSVTSDPDYNLTSQAIDYLPPGGSSWISGSSSNGNRWDGSPTNSETLQNTMPLSTAGTWQFRARGGDNLGGLSSFQYLNVTVAALGPPPVTTLSASAGSSVTGNGNASSPPSLLVPSGQNFTITSQSTDADNNLVQQQFDLSSDNGSTWSLGTSSNGRLWTGSATNSNPLSKSFGLPDGHYRFRAQALDAQQQLSAYQYVDVIVATAPAITSQPAAASVVVGASATFTVSVSGSAPLSYQWYKNGAAISGATNASYSIATVQYTDAGTYTVTAANIAGSVTSNGATLAVGTASGDNSQIKLDIHLPTTL